MVTVDDMSAHADEHTVPVMLVESRLAAFDAGRNPLGSMFSGAGGTGGTEVSEDTHHVAGADRAAAEMAEAGQV
jgi:hypothetical protein